MSRDFLKTLPQFIAPKHTLTSMAGKLAEVKVPAVKNRLIKRFIAKYSVNMSEAYEENPENYACFNDFFIRHLKPDCRPLADADIVSPVDGVISELGRIDRGQLLQAKGRYYSVDDFLACEPSRYEPFVNGRFATLYLSPKDYHRIHMPIKATLQHMIYVPGKLFSVQPATARTVPRLFARNERLVVFFETQVGLMAMVLVGAVIVGAIGTAWEGDLKRLHQVQEFSYAESPLSLEQGQEMGYFKLGSTVVLMFANGAKVDWLPSLKAGDGIRYGEALATISP
ncbi:phosphatidylserine decarboxylase [Legionella sp. MW5194]|uniref:archaetidylserine decarboxylase n=1 Tax=Legionella sp. MW5194 TaxID=2662448 RepID=UPI00193D79B5|nr:archaetidylserine decarboxylase [Legionella sp. MW5194]QRN04964.1 phosphatidylserine decarboxylase [Legionella sp. MW5194]